jgi:hypothetical protein
MSEAARAQFTQAVEGSPVDEAVIFVARGLSIYRRLLAVYSQYCVAEEEEEPDPLLPALHTAFGAIIDSAGPWVSEVAQALPVPIFQTTLQLMYREFNCVASHALNNSRTMSREAAEHRAMRIRELAGSMHETLVRAPPMYVDFSWARTCVLEARRTPKWTRSTK